MKLFKKEKDSKQPADTPVIPAPRDEADSVINIDAGEGDVPHEAPNEAPDEATKPPESEEPKRKAS